MFMNCAIKPIRNEDPIQYGRFLGLLADQGCDRCGGGDPSAVVAIDGYGLMLSLIHPSRVVLLDRGRDARD
jgi:hypothetical protein